MVVGPRYIPGGPRSAPRQLPNGLEHAQHEVLKSSHVAGFVLTGEMNKGQTTPLTERQARACLLQAIPVEKPRGWAYAPWHSFEIMYADGTTETGQFFLDQTLGRIADRYFCYNRNAPIPKGGGWSLDTDQVPDASKITPPVTPEGMRAGHDINLMVNIDSGVGLTIRDVDCTSHEINWNPINPGNYMVALKNETEIPNKDFILHYYLGEPKEIGDAFLVHSDERGSFFTLILQPPRRIVPEQLVSRELIFVVDTSGSMSGFPIKKAKQVMSRAIDAMRSGDTFNLITFAGHTRILWDAPRANTAENRDEAQAFLASRRGGGGTEMMKAINAALIAGHEPDRLRVVCFMTDGYVGNEFAIIDAVRNNAGTSRVFSFGIGNSVNRFLLDGMAHAGRGEVEYVTLESQADAAVERLHERILAPVLTDIEIDWGDLPVADVYPKQIPDLFSAKPVMIHGRLTGPPKGTITLRGNTGSGAYEAQIACGGPYNFPDALSTSHPALPSLWARAKVKDLMMQDMRALQNNSFPDDLKRQITNLGVEFRLMTQFTSFVAVEEMTVTIDGEAVRVDVPVEMPEGVDYEGVFGVGSKSASVRLRSRGFSAHRRVASSPRQAQARRAPAANKAARADADIEERERAEDLKAEKTPAERAAEAWKQKLTGGLRGLGEQVRKEGKNGNFIAGTLHVRDYRIIVMIHLRDTSKGVLESLAQLGFVQAGESKAVKLVIGTIDVRRLEALAKLAAVLRVSPLKR